MQHDIKMEPHFLKLPRDLSECCSLSHGGYFGEAPFFVFVSPYKEVLEKLEPHVIAIYLDKLKNNEKTACGVWENNPVIAACGHFYDLSTQSHALPRAIEWDLWIKSDVQISENITDLFKLVMVANGHVAHGNPEVMFYEQNYADGFHKLCNLPASKLGGVSVRQWMLAYSRALSLLVGMEDPSFERQAALDDRLNHEQKMHREDGFYYSFPVEARNIRESITFSAHRIQKVWRHLLIKYRNYDASLPEDAPLPHYLPLFLDIKSTRMSARTLANIVVPVLNSWGIHVVAAGAFDHLQTRHIPSIEQTVYVVAPYQTPSSTRSRLNQEETAFAPLSASRFPPPMRLWFMHSAGDVLSAFRSKSITADDNIAFNASTMLRAVKKNGNTKKKIEHAFQSLLLEGHDLSGLQTLPPCPNVSTDILPTEPTPGSAYDRIPTAANSIPLTASEADMRSAEASDGSSMWFVEVDPAIHRGLLAIRQRTKCTLQVYTQEHHIDPACALAVMRYCASPQGQAVLNGGLSWGGVEGRVAVSSTRLLSLPSVLKTHLLTAADLMTMPRGCLSSSANDVSVPTACPSGLCFDVRHMKPLASTNVRSGWSSNGSSWVYGDRIDGYFAELENDDILELSRIDSSFSIPLVNGGANSRLVSVLMAPGGQELVGDAWVRRFAPQPSIASLIVPKIADRSSLSSVDTMQRDANNVFNCTCDSGVETLHDGDLEWYGDFEDIVDTVHVGDGWGEAVKRVMVKGLLSVAGGLFNSKSLELELELELEAKDPEASGK